MSVGRSRSLERREALEARLYKTELCIFFARGFCANGIRCCYGHGEEDLRESPYFYKTKLCREFNTWGSCRFGLKCNFAHGACELRDARVRRNESRPWEERRWEKQHWQDGGSSSSSFQQREQPEPIFAVRAASSPCRQWVERVNNPVDATWPIDVRIAGAVPSPEHIPIPRALISRQANQCKELVPSACLWQ